MVNRDVYFERGGLFHLGLSYLVEDGQLKELLCRLPEVWVEFEQFANQESEFFLDFWEF